MDTNIFEKPIKKKKKRKIIIIKKPKPTTKTATKPAPKPKRKRRSKEEIRSAAIERGINPDQKKLGELIRDYDRLKTKPKGEYVRGTKKKKIVISKPKPSVKKRRTKLQILAAIKAAGIDTSLTLKQQKERLKTLDTARAKEEKRILDTIKYEFMIGASDEGDWIELDDIDDNVEFDIFNTKIQVIIDKGPSLTNRVVLKFLVGDILLEKGGGMMLGDDYGGDVFDILVRYLSKFRILDIYQLKWSKVYHKPDDSPWRRDKKIINSGKRYIVSSMSRQAARYGQTGTERKWIYETKRDIGDIMIDMETAKIKVKTQDTKTGRKLRKWYDAWVAVKDSQPTINDLWDEEEVRKLKINGYGEFISETEALAF